MKDRQRWIVGAIVLTVLVVALPAAAQPPQVNPNNVVEIPQFVDQAIARAIDNSARNTVYGWGRDLMRGIAVILIVWTGLQIAFSGTFHRWELIKFVMTLMIPWTMIQSYNSPIPGVGMSFVDLITDQGTAIMDLFGADALATGAATVMQLVESHVKLIGEEAASLSVVGAAISGGKQFTHMALMTAILGSFSLGMIVVIALALAQLIFANVATSILVALGPLFIPFMIVPKMDFLFWGWFKAMIQFSLYGAIASIMVSIWARIIQTFAGSIEATNFTINSLTVGTGVWLLPVLAVIICAIVCMLKVGDIAGMIVGGGSDGGGFMAGAFVAGRIVAAPARVAAAPMKGGLPT